MIMSKLYKGFIETKGKASIEKLKNRTTWKTYDEVKNLNGFGGVLADDTILIDIDDSDQSEILMNIVEELQLDCKVLCTSRGKHFLFKNHTIARNRTHVQLAVGLTADIKVGSKLSYEVIKIDGEERFCEWDIEEGGKYQEVPKWLFPVKATADFVDMDAGDGRNQALFNYILTLTANDFTVEETRECIRILNKFVLKQPLSDDELEVILRDDAFQKPVFFLGSTFLFDKFANYMINNHHIGIHSHLEIIAPEAAHVLYDDALDPSCLDVGKHTLEARTVEVCAGIAVVLVIMAVGGNPVILAVAFQNLLLVRYGVTFTIQLIFLRKALIQGGQTFFLCFRRKPLGVELQNIIADHAAKLIAQTVLRLQALKGKSRHLHSPPFSEELR